MTFSVVVVVTAFVGRLVVAVSFTVTVVPFVVEAATHVVEVTVVSLVFSAVVVISSVVASVVSSVSAVTVVVVAVTVVVVSAGACVLSAYSLLQPVSASANTHAYTAHRIRFLFTESPPLPSSLQYTENLAKVQQIFQRIYMLCSKPCVCSGCA